jgi:alpha/beta superfamily hydrolase
MWSKLTSCFLLISLLSGCAVAGGTDNIMKLEERVCGVKEPFIFWLWSNAAGRPNSKRLVGLNNVKDIEYKTKDGRTLRGYQLAARETKPAQENKAKGFLLVLQGNAILADQILAEYSRYAQAGYDVYIYDYRGYGRSEGKRRLKAMISDVKEIINYLSTKPYKKRLVYAMSFGGILFLDALDAHIKLDKVIIDSTPSRLSGYGCPKNYDPITHLPEECSNYMFITGQRDRVVTTKMAKDMLKKAQQCHAKIIRDAEFAHPFMDADFSVHQRRMKTIEQFLLQQ